MSTFTPSSYNCNRPLAVLPQVQQVAMDKPGGEQPPELSALVSMCDLTGEHSGAPKGGRD